MVKALHVVSANRLPRPIQGAAAVPYEESFLLVGGFTDDLESADILKYDAAEDEWIKMEAELKTPRYDHVALLVDQSLFPECSEK